jgi:hypothetical protein
VWVTYNKDGGKNGKGSFEFFKNYIGEIPEATESAKKSITDLFELVDSDTTINQFISEFDDLFKDLNITDESLQDFLKTTQKSGKVYNSAEEALAGYNAYLKETAKSSKVATAGTKALAKVGSVLSSIGWMVAITAITAIINAAINSEKEMSEAINNASETLDEQTSSLDSNMQKLSELRDELDNGNLSYEDAATKRSELIDIQSSLIKTYGEEAEGIDLVNGSLEDQLGLLDEIKKQNIQKAVNAANKRGWWGNFINGVGNIANLLMLGGNQGLIYKLFNITDDLTPGWKWNSNYWGTGTSISQSRNKYNNYSKKFNVTNNDEINKYIESFDNIERIGNSFKISGDADKVKDTIAEIQRTLKGSSEYAGDLEQRLTNIYNNASDYSDEWKNGNDLYYLGKIVNDDELYDYYERGAEAYNDYQKAIESGNEVDKSKAIEDYQELLSEMEQAGVEKGIIDYIKSIAPDMQSAFNDYTFTVKIQPQLDDSNSTVSKDADLLNDFSADELSQKWEDLSNGVAVDLTEAQQQALLSLNSLATSCGYSLDELLAKLEELGYLKDPLITMGEDAQKYLTGTSDGIKDDVQSVSQTIADSEQALKEENDKIHEWGLDDYADKIRNGTIQSKYGNVDMDDRQIIDWNIDNIEEWRDQLSDIKYYDDDGNFIDSYYDQLKKSAEEGYTNIDTVFGDMIDHIEGYDGISSLAFSHIVNNDDGTFEFLGQKTAQEYIYGILDTAKKDGDLSIDHILELDKNGIKNASMYDAQGKKIGESYIHGIIAGFNSDAKDVSSLLHMSGKFGGYQIAKNPFDPAYSDKTDEEGINDYIAGLVKDGNKEDLDLILGMSIDEKSKIHSAEDLDKWLKEQHKKQLEIKVSTSIDTAKAADTTKDAFTALDKALADYQKNGIKGMDVDNLTALNAEGMFGSIDGSTAAYEEFLSVMQDVNSTTEEVQDAFDTLATKFLYHSELQEQITEENRDWVESELTKNGVTNASAVAEQMLINKYGAESQAIQEVVQYQHSLGNSKYTAADATDMLENASVSEIGNLINEANALGQSSIALKQYMFDKVTANGTVLNTDGDLQNLLALGEGIAGANDLLTTYIKLKAKMEDPNTKSGEVGALQHQADETYLQWKIKVKNGLKAQVKANTSPGGSYYKGSGDSGKSASDSAKEAQDTSKQYDWIAIAIQRCEEAITSLDRAEGNTYEWWSKRNKALLEEINQTAREIELLQYSYNGYMNAANAVGLSDDYKQKVINGTIQIETVTDENLQKKIDEFQQWWEKARDCKDKIDELNISLSKLAQQKFDNIVSHFEEREKAFTGLNDILDAQVKLAEAKGQIVSRKYYDAMIKNEQSNNKLLVQQRDQMVKSLNEAVSSGKIKQGSEAWYDMKAQIDAINKAIIESNTSLQEFQNSIRQLEWDKFDRLIEEIQDVADEIDWVSSLLKDDDLTDGKSNRGLTDKGNAKMGSYASMYNLYLAESQKYASEIKKIDKELAKDPYNQDLIDRKKELIKAQRDAISSAEDEKDAMIDLARKGYDAILESLQDLIDKKKEALESEKD